MSVEDRETVVSLFDGNDPRLGELAGAIMDILFERGDGLPLVTVLGVLRLVENCLIQKQREIIRA
ncbi:MAG: hypothetical protein KGL39_30300 [Patescibacteria group bacterium]|nr:hypothetical protein [Patescibacteria group bacterium]